MTSWPPVKGGKGALGEFMRMAERLISAFEFRLSSAEYSENRPTTR
jgi:hypothetical protein